MKVLTILLIFFSLSCSVNTAYTVYSKENYSSDEFKKVIKKDRHTRIEYFKNNELSQIDFILKCKTEIGIGENCDNLIKFQDISKVLQERKRSDDFPLAIFGAFFNGIFG